MGRLSNAFSSGARLRSLGFQSKLLLMLLTVSVLSVLVAGVIGYLSGTSSMRNAEYQRLTQLRESRARAITDAMKSITDSAAILTHSSSTTTAVRDFSAAFNDLQKAPLPPERREAVAKYYADVFGPALAKNTGEEGRPDAVQADLECPDLPQDLYMVPARATSTPR